MLERDFKAKLRKKLKPLVEHVQSIASYTKDGTPDIWISDTHDLWIEAKRDETTKGPITPNLSKLQAKWCNDRYAQGRQVIVIVGINLKEGIVYEHGTWNEASNHRIPLDEIIKIILGYVK